MPDRRRSAPSGGRERHEVRERGGKLFKQGPQDRLCRTAGAGLRDAALLRAVQACTAGSEPRHTAPSGGRKLHEVSDRGGLATGYLHAVDQNRTDGFSAVVVGIRTHGLDTHQHGFEVAGNRDFFDRKRDAAVFDPEA